MFLWCSAGSSEKPAPAHRHRRVIDDDDFIDDTDDSECDISAPAKKNLRVGSLAARQNHATLSQDMGAVEKDNSFGES